MMRGMMRGAALLAALLFAVAAEAADSAAFQALVKAAQQEGSVVLDGPPLDKAREAITQQFAKTYGISMTYISSGGPKSAPRIRAERAADRYLLDVFVTGADTAMFTVLPSGWVDPIEPALVDPRVTDAGSWRDGHLWFADPGHKMLRLFAYVTPTLAINTKLVKPGEIGRYADLLDAKWRGKIIAKDPTVTGAAGSLISYLYLTFGGDYVAKLYKEQKPFISRDTRQAGQALANGNYPIWLGVDMHETLHFRQLGYPVEFVFPSDGPRIVSGGWGFVGLMNKAPHPNAAKLLVNWLAGPEGSATYAKAAEFLSLRTDIDQHWAEDFVILKPGQPYLDTYDYKFITEQRDQAFERVQKLLGL
jgi:iron(III) transport system substrate-binding protein